MTILFKKLNYKDHISIVALNSPATFEKELDLISDQTRILKDLKKVTDIHFAMVFVTAQTEIDHLAPKLNKRLVGDAVLWFCYPKGTSKKYKCDFNRDNGWASLGKLDLEPVRMVAIDEDWSALRFRKVAFIKTITRRESFALTKEARKRTTQKDQ